ncbi:MAG TPA: hypothetical protein VGJ05_17560 [Fimbriiglobus sp.]|jgi:hypothetical protein
MKNLILALLAGVGIMTSAATANAQYYYGYNYGTQVYYPPGYGFNPGYSYGYYPGVNRTVVSVSPYWRPLVTYTPVITTPFGPNYYYSNNYSFRASPFGFNWSASHYQWVNGGIYSPPIFAYPSYGYGYPTVEPANPVPAPVAVVVPVRGRITRGFVPNANAFVGDFVVPTAGTTTENGSFTAWGAYMPGTGTYFNPFNGVVAR